MDRPDETGHAERGLNEPEGGPVPTRPVDPYGAEPELDGSELSERTIVAAQWQTGSSVVRGVLQFGVVVVLARLLTPEAFGLAALAMIVVGFAEMVVDLGLGPAMVQKANITERHVRTSFTGSTLLGVGLAVVLAAAAPVFAPILGDPAVTPVLRWSAILFVFSGVGATARSLLQRRLDFRGRFFVDFAGYGIGYAITAVALAVLGFGVWSLVIGSLVQGAVGAVVALALARHSLRPLLAREEMRDLLGFGFGVVLNRSVVYISFNGSNFVVGRWLGAAALGLYSRAYQLMQLPVYHMGNITWHVLFAAYSRLQADPLRAAAAYLKGIQLTTLTVAPIMAGMIAAGPHLVVGLYGAQWTGATLPLQILCAAGVLRAIYTATGALTHAFGAVYAEFRRQALYGALVVGLGILGARWGITGVAVSMAVSILFMYLAMAQLGIRISGCRWRDFFGAQLAGLALATLVAAVAFATRLLLERHELGSTLVLLAVVAASVVAVPAGLFLMPAWMRPTELFASLERTVARLPSRIQRPMRRVMHLSSKPVHARTCEMTPHRP